VTLACSQEWFLRAPANLPKDATDMSRLIADTELVLDQSGYATPGPDRTAKAKGFGTLCQQFYELDALIWHEQSWPTGMRSGTKGLPSLKRATLEPLTD